MDSLRKQLKLLVDDLPQLFRRLGETILPTCGKSNEIIQLERQFLESKKEWQLGRITRETADITANRVVDAMLDLIDQIEPQDLKTPAAAVPTGAAGLHDYHCHTCDRMPQSELFHQLFDQKKESKTHFFYLYGLDLQSPKGFFKRLAFDLEGKLQDFLNPDFDAGCKSLKVELPIEASTNEAVYKQNILKNLFVSLDVRVNETEPLLEKNIGWLWQKSPAVQGLRSNDFVCVLLRISQWDWDKVVTPKVIKWFIEEFCKGDLPAECPVFLFFFAVIFEEEGSDAEREVEELVTQSSLVNALPELGMVLKNDVARWFSKYELIAASSRERQELRVKHFGEAAEHYMEDVEIKLKKLIDEHNRRFF